jgi:hypothetical protein
MMKRTKIRVAGKSTTAEVKREIQALLREIVMIRDKKCILHGVRCNHEVGMEGVVWQAEHLVERSNSATFADHRLVVLVCRNCHGWKHFKKSNHDQYDAWVKMKLPTDRKALWEMCEKNIWQPRRTTAFDWKLEKLALEAVLRNLQ